MARQALVVLIVVVTFGILVPWYKGVAFLQPWVVAIYGCMALLFVAPAASNFRDANPDPLPAGTLLGRLFQLALFAWAIGLLTLAAAVTTVSLVYGHGRFLTIPTALYGAVLVFSLIASTAVACLSALLARRLTAANARGILRGLFLLVLMAFAFGPRFFPESWQIALNDLTTRRAITRLAWEGSLVAAVLSALLAAGLLEAFDKRRLRKFRADKGRGVTS